MNRNWSPRIFFRAFTDYDLHVLAIAADILATHRRAPWLRRSQEDNALIRDMNSIAARVLRERVSTGPDGRGFHFDRGAWRDNPVAAYARCTEPTLPRRECPAEDYVTDVSHGQRWPVWLASFAEAARGTPEEARVELWRRNLARQVVEQVVRFDAAGRPVMANFLDGSDGWYNVVQTGSGTGHRPSSLTGWAMRMGNWQLLADYDPRIREVYARFCRVITSNDPADIRFRTERYGAPGPDPANGYASARDEFGADSFYVLPCRIYGALPRGPG